MALTPKQRKAALEKGFAVNLASPDDAKYLSPNPKAATQLFTKASEGALTGTPLPADRQSAALPADGLPRHTADRQYYRQTVSRFDESGRRSTGSGSDPEIPISLPSDGLPVVNETLDVDPTKTIPLAPVQWALWETLCEADASDQMVSYRKLALRLNASIRGIRDAMTVLEKVGGILSKFTIRTPDEQGMRIKVNIAHPFRKSSLKETKALLKRESDYRQTVDRQSPMLPADRLRLSVSFSDYIKQTDVAELLSLFPPTWNIRERTLVEIAKQFPRMTPIEYRRSVLLLVEQVTKSQTQIQSHNAWLKAAFANNEGPLVTERMIDAQLNHVGSRVKDKNPGVVSRKDTADNDLHSDLTALRKYVTAQPEEREKIDEKAKEKAEAALRITPTNKHNEILEQALIEASREFFSSSPAKSS